MNNYNIPHPIVDAKELNDLDKLTARYEKLIKPNAIVNAGKKVGDKAIAIIPDKVKDIGIRAKDYISEQELFTEAMKIVADSFKIIEEQSAKFTISEKDIVKKINKASKRKDITKLEEICLVRGYDISKSANSTKTQNLALALGEGAATGVIGFWGIPFNLALSTFLYFRAVQSVAMFYGYDVKNDPAEMAIAGEIFMTALSPTTNGTSGLSDSIVKVMVVSKAAALKQASSSWQKMAEAGGIALTLTQIRALAHKSAQKALEKAGKKGMEKSMFTEMFEQIGKKLTQKAIKGALPYVSAGISGLVDLSQMNRVYEYADVFYNKRFILEKENRINLLTGWSNDVIDVDVVENVQKVKVKPRRIK